VASRKRQGTAALRVIDVKALPPHSLASSNQQSELVPVGNLSAGVISWLVMC